MFFMYQVLYNSILFFLSRRGHFLYAILFKNGNVFCEKSMGKANAIVLAKLYTHLERHNMKHQYDMIQPYMKFQIDLK